MCLGECQHITNAVYILAGFFLIELLVLDSVKNIYRFLEEVDLLYVTDFLNSSWQSCNIGCHFHLTHEEAEMNHGRVLA